MEQKELAIHVDRVSKVYKLYRRNRDRLIESLGLTKKKLSTPHYALKDVSLDIYKGETVGIIGTNGSGKSTILKIITGVLHETSGTVQVNGRISALLELGAGFNMEYNGIENIYLNGTMIGFSEKEIDEKLQDILDFADIGDYVYQPVKTYSSGMFVRLAFAVAINIVDERKAVTEYAQKLQTEIFPDLKVAFVHGKMKAKEKDAVMSAFAAGKTDILVSTTVIEVGVDVPNANLMVVENAERFGLSQLHQLRGRVGRGQHQSYCVLVSDNKNDETRQRLKAMTKTADGFKIAEEDLRLRGPGDFFGLRQHGLPGLRVADLGCDTRLLAEAQSAADGLLAEDPALTHHPATAERVRKLFQQSENSLN